MNPKVSIITTYYISKPPQSFEVRAICDTFRAVFDQTIDPERFKSGTGDFDDWEWIIWSDGAPWSISQMIDQFIRGSRYPFLREELVERVKKGQIQWRNGGRLGRPMALNQAIAWAKGEYISIQDWGDLPRPDKLETLATFLDRNPKYVLVGSAFERIDEEGNPLGTDKILMDDSEIRNALETGKNAFCHSATLYRKSSFNEVEAVYGQGYRGFFTYSCEYDLWLRMMGTGKMFNFPNVMASWRLTPNSASIAHRKAQKWYRDMALMFYNQRMLNKDRTDSLMRQEDIIGLLGYQERSKSPERTKRDNFAEYYFQIGKSFILGGTSWMGKESFKKAIKIRPWIPRYLLFLGLSYLSDSILGWMRRKVGR